MPVGTRFAGTTGFAHSGRGAPGVSLFSEQQLFASAALSPAALHRGDRRLVRDLGVLALIVFTGLGGRLFAPLAAWP